MVRNVSMTFFISGVHRSSLVFWLVCWACWCSFRRVQFRVPYSSIMWLSNCIVRRWVRMKGCFGLVLPYFWLIPIMPTFTAPQRLPVLAMPPPKAVTVFGVTFML